MAGENAVKELVKKLAQNPKLKKLV